MDNEKSSSNAYSIDNYNIIASHNLNSGHHHPSEYPLHPMMNGQPHLTPNIHPNSQETDHKDILIMNGQPPHIKPNIHPNSQETAHADILMMTITTTTTTTTTTTANANSSSSSSSSAAATDACHPTDTPNIHIDVPMMPSSSNSNNSNTNGFSDSPNTPNTPNTPNNNNNNNNTIQQQLLTANRLESLNATMKKCSIVILVLQIISCTVALIVSWRQPCQQPQLRPFLTVFALSSCLNLYLLHRADQNAFSRQLYSITDTFATLWLFFGSIYLMGGPASNSCAKTAPVLYYTCVFWIAYGYAVIVLPLVLCTGILCCLPGSMLLYGRLRKWQNRRAARRNIDSLRSLKYSGSSRVGWREDGLFVDDNCPICLVDYRDGDELRVLGCQHVFHSGCALNWLEINNACPICQRPAFG